MNPQLIFKISICLLASYFAYSSHSARFFESSILGYEPNTLYNLARILFPIPLSFFGAWISITTLTNLFNVNTKQKSQNIRSIGEMVNISYSDTRINGKPLFKITISYDDHLKVFDNIESNINFNLKNGDPSIVYYEEGYPDNAYFDLKESIKYNSTVS